MKNFATHYYKQLEAVIQSGISCQLQTLIVIVGIFSDFDFGPDGTDTVQKKILKPGDKNKLTCDIIGNPTPKFAWNTTKVDVDLSGEISRGLDLDSRERSDGDREIITCIGTVDYKGQSIRLVNSKATKLHAHCRYRREPDWAITYTFLTKRQTMV